MRQFSLKRGAERARLSLDGEAIVVDHGRGAERMAHRSRATAARKFEALIAAYLAQGWALETSFEPAPVVEEPEPVYDPTRDAPPLPRDPRYEMREGDSSLVLETREPVGRAAFVQQLRTLTPRRVDFQGPHSAAWIAALAPLSCTSLVCDVPWDTVTRQTYAVDLGDLGALLRAAPSALRAWFSGQQRATQLAHPYLEILHAMANPLDPTVLEALTRAKLPALRTLALGLGFDAPPDEGALHALTTLLERPRFELRELHLGGLVGIETWVARIAESPLARSLRRLSLPYGSVSDEDALVQVLTKAMGRFVAIEQLSLSLDDVSLPAVDAICALHPAVSPDDASAVLPAGYARW